MEGWGDKADAAASSSGSDIVTGPTAAAGRQLC
jgi:hypothetical protein